jgi:hypothetical protein
MDHLRAETLSTFRKLRTVCLLQCKVENDLRNIRSLRTAITPRMLIGMLIEEHADHGRIRERSVGGCNEGKKEDKSVS